MSESTPLQRRRLSMQLAGRVQIIRTATRIEAITPYHEDFNKAAKLLGGKWESSTRAWVFKLSLYNAVIKLADKVYGLRVSKGGKCPHRYLKVAGGIKCLLCAHFKERSL